VCEVIKYFLMKRVYKIYFMMKMKIYVEEVEVIKFLMMKK